MIRIKEWLRGLDLSDVIWWLIAVPVLIYIAVSVAGEGGLIGLMEVVVVPVIFLGFVVILWLFLAWLYVKLVHRDK